MSNNELPVNDVKKEKPSLWGVLWSPVQTFAQIKENPKILMPFIIVTILTVLGALISVFNTDLILMEKEAQLQGELGTGVSGESMEALATIVKVTSVIFSALTPAFTVLISSAILLLIAKIARSPVTFKQLFSMNTYIFLLIALSTIINNLGKLITKNPMVQITSLASLIPAEGPLLGLLMNIEVFTIWTVFLTAIGLNIVASFSKKLSWTVSILFYVFGIILSMISTGINATMM